MNFSSEKFILTRRGFLALSATTAAAVAGCATNPVSGRRQFMLVSENQEIRVDTENAPHQLSADYGALQDDALNRYVASVGDALAAASHRPNMPYSFRGVNATYINAYAFPGGTIAVTRGMLVGMESEAELAAVLGHEIGHVASRHTAQSMTKGLLASAALALAAAYVERRNEKYAALTAGLGAIAEGALLARYSRAHERQADALGLEYMTKAGYNPDGFIDLMDLLRSLSKEKPNAIELLFATHPMSDERYQTAVDAVRGQYGGFKQHPLNRERFMDQTARLRAIQGAIERLQQGEKALADDQLNDAATHFEAALKQAPHDYVGLLLLAKCRLAQKRPADAVRVGEQAQAVYPGEAQAWHVTGLARVSGRQFDAALRDFNRYEELLPGNPNTVFFKGYAFEGMQRRREAAEQYVHYLQTTQEGDYAEHAYAKLVEWGYVEKTQPQR